MIEHLLEALGEEYAPPVDRRCVGALICGTASLSGGGMEMAMVMVSEVIELILVSAVEDKSSPRGARYEEIAGVSTGRRRSGHLADHAGPR